jgi:hypothetical protein
VTSKGGKWCCWSRTTGQTGAGLGARQFRFCARDDAQFSSFCRGIGGWHGESSGVPFARRSPPCAQ